jgi:3-phosphoshikimate 1-carboxyvinyltransferase
LHGIDIPASLIPLAIDEFPAVFVAAACAEGTTVLRGAAELRVKESDRIEAMAEGLAKLGIVSTPAPDGIAIRGGSIGGGALDSHGDHRVAMSFAMAALRARAPIAIARTENVATSFPGFVEMAVALGLRIGRTGVTGHA